MKRNLINVSVERCGAACVLIVALAAAACGSPQAARDAGDGGQGDGNSDLAATNAGACAPNRTCATGYRCSAQTTCEPCGLGTLGCACTQPQMGCGPGLTCMDSRCVSAEVATAQLPSKIVCFSPCANDVTESDGRIRTCGPDRLMEGCLAGQTCTQGSCVEDPKQVPACASDVDCPDFQTCIQGRCYAACQYDSDCGQGNKCHRHVCRVPCQAGGAACTPSTFCSLIDADRGVCVPQVAPQAGPPQTRVEGAFRVSAEHFDFSNTQVIQTLTIVNEAARPLDFTIRKVEHIEFKEEGAVTVTKAPLPWLAMGEEGKTSRASEIVLRVPGNKGSLAVRLDTSGEGVPSRWEGTLEISSPELGTRTVSLTYAARPDGRWVGKMYYFAQFSDTHLADWTADRANAEKLELVGNAFIRKWGAFRRGRISIEEMKAVITSTTSGSWKWESVRSACRPLGREACYLYSGSSTGVSVYSDSLESQPVPSGVVELPMALDLKLSSAMELSGKIVSSIALHYAGEPAISLSFAGDPSKCSTTGGPTCLTYFSGLDSNAIVGGRYRMLPGERTCASLGGRTFLTNAQPFLPPSFGTTVPLDEKGVPVKLECRDTAGPAAGGDDAAKTRNASLAGANPIPDGRVRQRHLDLVDGVLVNQDQMFIVVRERFDDDFLGTKGTGFAGYGLLVLKRTNAQLDTSAFAGTSQSPPVGGSSAVNLDDGLTCSPDVIRSVLGSIPTGVVPASQLADRVLNGAGAVPSLRAAIKTAFRYKTQFQSRSGTSVGFAPTVCRPGDTAGYCYSSDEIEGVRARVDCLINLLSSRSGDLDPTVRNDVVRFLDTSFSYTTRPEPQNPTGYVTEDGFERLYAELLVMLGDDAYTSAFRSRFDLAGTLLGDFPGERFEPGGKSLSGVAGFEMRTLHQALQYYQLALDRFYGMVPAIWRSLSPDTPPDQIFITTRTATSYLARVLRASTQKSRAASEIARRYQSLNQPQIARTLLERAYTATYLESVVLNRLVLRLEASAAEVARAEIRKAIEDSANTFRAVMVDMRETYASLRDEANLFGFTADYVPFPPLEPGETNAFTKIWQSARQLADTAATKESMADAATRSYDVDKETFQAELSRVRNNYESQLSAICGTFKAPSGSVFPAIQKYAYLDPTLRRLENPCGLVGNGAAADAIAQAELIALDADGISQSNARLTSEIAIEQEKYDKLCKIALDRADFKWQTATGALSLEDQIRDAKNQITQLDRMRDFWGQITSLMKCNVGVATDCPTAAAAAVLYNLFTFAVYYPEVDALQTEIGKKEDEIVKLQASALKTEAMKYDCAVFKAEGAASIARIGLQFADLALEARKNRRRMSIATGVIEGLANQAIRIEAEQREAEQFSLNIEASRNDPNVRIYKNDALITAERTFQNAIREAYRATKVFEYYTSQSYARADQLTLIRLVTKGDYSLDRYLDELKQAFNEFAEQAGRPDLRTDILSLRDDVLQIPLYADDGRPLTQSERVDRFRGELADARWLDAKGYLVIPFDTTLKRLSPITRVHKVSSLEVEIIAADRGDDIGRIYLEQAGTGVIHGLDDAKTYYRFPSRTAVVNTLFNGVRTFMPDYYRNERLRDRPYANTNWELTFNQRDELVNQDINLRSISDIRIYLHYNDFTKAR